MSHIENLWLTDTATNPDIRNNCCGCEACANICHYNAITMKHDAEGFLYPKVDLSLCINCGLCEKVCPFTNSSFTGERYLKTYGGYTTDNELLFKCTSGGLITALSLQMINRGGVVAGVRYSEDYVHAVYDLARTADEVMKFSGSKYVQSEKNKIFHIVENELKSGTEVLFVGCPCDVQALKNYLGKTYHLLICVEFVCMGVSSYRIAEEYKKYVEKKYNDTLVAINARSKAKGWFVPHLEEVYASSKIRSNTLFGTYLGYGMQVYNRPSCFNCTFRGVNGVGDIRVGDYWGIKETDKFWNPDGVSCIFVRTQKGIEELKTLEQHGFALFESDYDIATQSNMSSHKNKSERYVLLRDKFSRVFANRGLVSACRATGTSSFWIRHIVPDRFHTGLKKIYHKVVDKRP